MTAPGTQLKEGLWPVSGAGRTVVSVLSKFANLNYDKFFVVVSKF